MKMIALALLFASTSALAQVVDEHPTCWGNETMTIGGETWCRVQPAAACTNCAKAYILDMSHGAPIALPKAEDDARMQRISKPASPYVPYGGGRSRCTADCDRPSAESHD